ncbi:MAG: hypothetical protein JWR38_3398 [Mucilaginibacter sp.]|nr:hypothetical protein [Mucilaginibacter sp.]
MKKFKILITGLFILAGCTSLFAQDKQILLPGPDGQVVFKLTSENGLLYYEVVNDRNPVIETSPLGLTIKDHVFADISSIRVIKSERINRSYLSRGVHDKAIDNCNSTLVECENSKGLEHFKLEVRVFNDGLAFRYIVPGNGESEITSDNTTFTIPGGSVTWSQGDIRSYEGKYQKRNIEDVKEGSLVGPPLTVKLPGGAGYAAITEGGAGHFAGMSLKADGQRGYKANLTGSTSVSGNIETPWRIIETGKDLNVLVNCDIISSVSPKPDPKLFPQGIATSWVKPGKSVWSWLAGNGGVTFENMKKFSKWAGELGIEYNLVDEGWSKWTDGSKDKWELIKDLVTYSDQQHVKVWVWKAYPDRNGVPGLEDAKARWDFFTQCKAVGVVGIKIDFFDTESQEVMAFYQDALKDAARLQLMLDFHGADKPTGQSSTWPNEMSREGIRGLENGSSWPEHNTTLPFTRYLAGHGDYTPLSFNQKIIGGTTLTHQVATVVAFTSPFLCLAVNPEELLNSPIKKFVIGIPTTWDETKVLAQSAIGETAVFARRKGQTWYLSVLNGAVTKDLSIDLSFLKPGNYNAVTIADDHASADKVMLSEKKYNRKNSIKLQLQAGGGFAAKFTKVDRSKP